MFDRYQRRRLAGAWPVAAVLLVPPTIAGAAQPASSAAGVPEGSAPTGSTASEAPNDALVATTLNVAGFALFGPDLNVELGRQFTGSVRGRAFGLGYLSHSMFTPEENRKLSLGSFSAGAGGRFYFSAAQGTFAGPYAGVAAEYLTAYIEETDEFGTLDTTTTFLIPSLEAGYRFLLGPVLLGGGGALGYAFGLTSECAYTAGTCTSDPIDNTVYAEAVVDVGLRF